MALFKKKTVAADVPESEDLDAIMRQYDRESNTRIWEGKVKLIVCIFLALFSLYCIIVSLFSDEYIEIKLTRFMGLILIAGYLTYPANKKHVLPNRMPWYDILLMVLGSGSFFYYAFNAQKIIELATKLSWYHIAIGCIGILCLVELCRRCVGIPILCVAGVLVAYAFINEFSYGATVGKALKNVVHTMFYTKNAILGTPVNVCYNYIVMFIIFGAFLERTNIANFFISLANRLAGWASGGPAKVAVISSALCGMVSGSSVGNTVTTGSVTIPMMKKTGYKPEFAGAVEASASTGGQIMPPIMGAAAFLMAEYTGLPYSQVALKAILPAVLYFAGIFIAVHLEAKRLKLQGIPKSELPKWGFLLKNLYLLLPLIFLVVLVAGDLKTMRVAAALSICVAFVIGGVNFLVTELTEGKKNGVPVITSLLNAGKKILFAGFDALVAGAKGSITVAVACAMAGIIAGSITMTGLASILINSIFNLAKDATIIGLVLTMLCCIVLGMGVPTTANYCIMASTCAPILVKLGFPMISAHFFVFYFGIVADITPPVALAAYAGAAIAKSNPMKTGINATKLAIAAFIVPYIFAYNPQMLLEGTNGWFDVVLLFITSLMGLFSVAAALNGHWFRKIPVAFRILLVAGGLCMMIPGWLTDLIGFAVLAGIGAYQYLLAKKEPVNA
ncbi:MAG: TRAP transporter fused permease subunit [Clostridia bacterium]|nr:TRAP transporter fused permease subunit [Clostridia bacterium]